MKNFEDFNLYAIELFSPFFSSPTIFKENYTPETEDQYASWHFIILSKGEYYYLTIANPDNGNNGWQFFTVKHIPNFCKEIERAFVFDIKNFEYTSEFFSSDLHVKNTPNINQYS